MSDTPTLPAVGGWTITGLLVTAGVLILDQATKHLALAHLTPAGREVDVPGPLVFELVFNDGGAFGVDAPSWLFLIVTVVVIVLVARTLPKVRWPSHSVAYGLLLGGALGNAIDRVVRSGDPGDARFLNGHVVDFISSHRFPEWLGSYQFPTFNVADVAITAGFIVLVTFMILSDRREAAYAAHHGLDVSELQAVR